MKIFIIISILFITKTALPQSAQLIFGPQDKSLGIDATLPIYKGIGIMSGIQKGTYIISKNYKIHNKRYKVGLSMQIFTKSTFHLNNSKTHLIFHAAYCINKYDKADKKHYKKHSADIGIRTNILNSPFTAGFNYDPISGVGAFTLGIFLKQKRSQ